MSHYLRWKEREKQLDRGCRRSTARTRLAKKGEPRHVKQSTADSYLGEVSADLCFFFDELGRKASGAVIARQLGSVRFHHLGHTVTEGNE